MTMNRPFSTLRQRGAIAPFAILMMAGILLTAAYVQDTVRMDANSRQLKRATDAAAMALGKEWLKQNAGFDEVRDQMASEYIHANLGLDTALALTLEEVTVTESNRKNNPAFTVSARFTARGDLTGFGHHSIAISSTAEVISTSQEIALVLDSSMTLVSSLGLNTDAQLHADAVLHFVDQLFGQDDQGTVNRERENLYISVVPFSNGVNLYDDDKPISGQTRLTQWTLPGALRPDEDHYRLGSRGFYDRYGDLTNLVYPDRRAKRQGFYRGTDNLNRRWVWEPSPAEQPFRLLARMTDTNAEANRPLASESRYFTLSTTGSGEFGGLQTISTDVGLPNTPVLPLTSSYSDIIDRVQRIKGDWEIWPMPGILWGGSTLSPSWRGEGGWGDSVLPKDYTQDSSGEIHNKSLVLFMEWFDGFAWDHIDTAEDYINVCRHFEEQGIVFYAIVRVLQPGDLDKAQGGSDVAPSAWLEPCTGGGERLQVISTSADLEQLEDAFDAVYDDMTYSNAYVRLID